MSRLALVGAVLLAGCALHSSLAIPSTQQLAGSWHGRISGFAGNATAVMTIADTGAYRGTMFLDSGDKPFAGAITVVDPGRVRYQGTMGNGTVRLEERAAGQVLRFVQDGGGGGASFSRRP
ncbi:MAG: hypothetical protein DMD91_07980 [Candidatus Rokuibacteriota bacterium]|nr:MAG: hypothetical protein DMD91_07980 [Candidatus Rokubacteria bacterium]